MTRRPSSRRCSATGRTLRALLAPTILFVILFAGATQGLAQSGPPPSAAGSSSAQTPSVDELEALEATIADEAKRNELLATIRGLIEARKAADASSPQSLSERLVAAAEGTALAGKDMVEGVVNEIGGMPGVINWFERLGSDGAMRGRLLHQLGFLAVILLAGWLAEAAVWWMLSAVRRRLSRPDRAGMARRAPLLVALAVLDLVPLAGFAAGSYATYLIVRPYISGTQVGEIGLQFLTAYIAARGLLAIARMLFAPGRPDVRMLPAGGETAIYLYVWARRFINLTVFGLFVIEATLILGMPRSGFDALVRILGFLVLILLIAFIAQNRAAVAGWVRGGQAPTATAPVRRGLAAVWHILAIAYAVGVFVVWAWRIEDGHAYLVRVTVWSVLILAVAILIVYALRRMLEDGLGVTDDQNRRYPLLRARANRYLPITIAGIRVIAAIVTALAILDVWGVDILAWLSQPLGSRIVGAAVSIAIVLAIAVLVWELANIAIERRLHAAESDTMGSKRAARLRTLLPLMRKALLILLTVLVALIILAEIGVHIGPLLAGAGIVGLAIGFGAQTLVKDIITGAFMLIEDALGVGDVVTVAGIGGLVEDMSIRSIRLRDLSGNVHTIPFSSVDTVTNMTKDFSYYLLDISVAYREDTDEVARVCCEIIEEMRGEADFAALILEPLEVLGVDQFAESAVILKARIKTKPIKQWVVGREFNRRLKKRFDQMGIEIPFPHRTLYFGVQKDGGAPAAHVQIDGGGAPSRPAAMSPEPTDDADAKRGGRNAQDRRMTYVAVDLPDPHPDAGPRGEDSGHEGDDDNGAR
ncbi:MAG: mechanosensitive ion channel [Rhodospirillales bacterium]|nr:mechanosensitive ion channel [Rhodospirillales bacterium]